MSPARISKAPAPVVDAPTGRSFRFSARTRRGAGLIPVQLRRRLAGVPPPAAMLFKNIRKEQRIEVG